MRPGGEEDAAWLVRFDGAQFLEGFGIIDIDTILVAHRHPDMLAARRELHMQHRLARLQRLDDLHGRHIDHLDGVVVRKGEIDPDLAAVRTCHDKDRLAVDGHASGLLPGALIDDQHLVVADSGQEHPVTGRRPPLQVRHLVNRQRLLTLAIVRHQPLNTSLQIPQIEPGQTILAEQAGDIVAAIRRNQGIVREFADTLELADLGILRVVHIRHPDLASIPETEDKALTGRINQSDHLGKIALIAVNGRNIHHQIKGLGIKHLDATRLIVADRYQPPVLRDGAANAVAGLHRSLYQLAGQNINLGEPPLTAEYVSITGIT